VRFCYTRLTDLDRSRPLRRCSSVFLLLVRLRTDNPVAPTRRIPRIDAHRISAAPSDGTVMSTGTAARLPSGVYYPAHLYTNANVYTQRANGSFSAPDRRVAEHALFGSALDVKLPPEVQPSSVRSPAPWRDLYNRLP